MRKEKIGLVNANQLKIKSQQINTKSKKYSTPDEIDIIFVKNKCNYKFSVLQTDSISNEIDKIRTKIDLGENPSYYYNGIKIDINKSCKKNNIIYNNSYIEIED